MPIGNGRLELPAQRRDGVIGSRAGGFGILMARSLVNELVYNQRGNAVLAVKYLI